MARVWRNWSGSVTNRPRRWLRPSSEDALQSTLERLAPADWPIRAIGAGHSSSAVVDAPGTLLAMDRLRGLVSVDASVHQATVLAGTTLSDLGRELYAHDLMLPNYGDVATQTIGGAIGTGTHGSGATLPNLSDMLVAATVLDARGRILTVDNRNPERLLALRVALGALGVLTRVTLQLEPHCDLERREYATRLDAALAHFDELVAGNRSFDFYWYPRRDDVKLRLVNAIGGGTPRLPYARLLERREGYPHEIVPTHSGIPHHFEECEYAVPREQGMACFAEVRQRILRRWRPVVGWRVLVRTVAGDDALISPCGQRDSITLSLHQNSSLPWREYFADLEPVFRAHGGRPHWAKKHTLDAHALAPLYPRWQRFAAVRDAMDPDGAFLTPALRELLVSPP